METFNELQEIGETASMKTKLTSWGIVAGIFVLTYQLGKRSGKNQEK